MHLIKSGNVLKIGGFCFTPNLATAATIFFDCWLQVHRDAGHDSDIIDKHLLSSSPE